MRILALLILCVAILPAETKTEKQLRAQVAELTDQLKKEQALSAQEKQAAGNANGGLTREYAKLRSRFDELAARCEAAMAERDAMKLQLKNHFEIDRFQERVHSVPIEQQPAQIIVKEVPRIEKKIEANHAENKAALDRNARISIESANDTRSDLAMMKKSISAIAIRQVSDEELLGRYGKLIEHQAVIDDRLWWALVGLVGLVLLSIGTAMYLIRYHLAGSPSKERDEASDIQGVAASAQ